jgi:hypothetical protein
MSTIPRNCVRYEGRIVTRKWLKTWAGKTPEDRVIRARVAALPERVPAESQEKFCRAATVMWIAMLDDELLADVWRYAVQLRKQKR